MLFICSFKHFLIIEQPFDKSLAVFVGGGEGDGGCDCLFRINTERFEKKYKPSLCLRVACETLLLLAFNAVKCLSHFSVFSHQQPYQSKPHHVWARPKIILVRRSKPFIALIGKKVNG